MRRNSFFSPSSPCGGLAPRATYGWRLIRTSSSAMASGASTESAPAAAAVGIPWKRAVAGSCAKVSPPASRISWSPRIPSMPVPESTTPMQRGPQSLDIERKKKSTGSGGSPECAAGTSIRWSLPWNMARFIPGGMT